MNIIIFNTVYVKLHDIAYHVTCFGTIQTTSRHLNYKI
jgi:hypothetical protein